MKKVRLTESDLARLVKKVINEGVCITSEDEKDYTELPSGQYQATVSTHGSGKCFKITINNQVYGI